MKKDFYIYTLTDPRSGEIRYVGRSVQPQKRFTEHWREAYWYRTHTIRRPLHDWLNELRAENLKPLIGIVETIEAGTYSGSECHPREWYWMTYFTRAGHRMTNKHHHKKLKSYTNSVENG